MPYGLIWHLHKLCKHEGPMNAFTKIHKPSRRKFKHVSGAIIFCFFFFFLPGRGAASGCNRAISRHCTRPSRWTNPEAPPTESWLRLSLFTFLQKTVPSVVVVFQISVGTRLLSEHVCVSSSSSASSLDGDSSRNVEEEKYKRPSEVAYNNV